MTRKVTINNLSNWDGEDYAVHYIGPGGHKLEKYIKPGEWVEINPYTSTGVSVEPKESKKPEPFYRDGKQVFPCQRIDFK